MKKFIYGYLLASWVADRVVQQATGKSIQDLARQVLQANTLSASGVDTRLLEKRLREHLSRLQN